MLSRRRTGSAFLALLVLTAALGAAPAAQAAATAPSTDLPPRLMALFASLWDAVLVRLSPLDVLSAADGEDPPPDPDPEEEEEEDPFGGSDGSGPGSGGGVTDPNGG